MNLKLLLNEAKDQVFCWLIPGPVQLLSLFQPRRFAHVVSAPFEEQVTNMTHQAVVKGCFTRPMRTKSARLPGRVGPVMTGIQATERTSVGPAPTEQT